MSSSGPTIYPSNTHLPDASPDAMLQLYRDLLEAEGLGCSSNDLVQSVDDWFVGQGFPTILFQPQHPADAGEATGAEPWEPGDDAARWVPGQDATEPLPAATPTLPEIQSGRAPRMSYHAWRRTQGVLVGAADADEWYWRCPVCRSWAGPYRDVMAAKRAGMDHRWHAHDVPAARRTEARKAARRVARHMTAAAFDELVSRLATDHTISIATAQATIKRTANAIDGYGLREDVLFATGKDLGTAADGDYGRPPHPRVVDLVTTIAGELGHPGWITSKVAR